MIETLASAKPEFDTPQRPLAAPADGRQHLISL